MIVVTLHDFLKGIHKYLRVNLFHNPQVDLQNALQRWLQELYSSLVVEHFAERDGSLKLDRQLLRKKALIDGINSLLYVLGVREIVFAELTINPSCAALEKRLLRCKVWKDMCFEHWLNTSSQVCMQSYSILKTSDCEEKSFLDSPIGVCT